jgi:hypothetical protein
MQQRSRDKLGIWKRRKQRHFPQVWMEQPSRLSRTRGLRRLYGLGGKLKHCLSLSLSLSPPPPPPFFSVLSVCLAASGGELGSNGTHAWWVAGVGWQRERRGPFSQGDADVRYVSSSARIDRRCAHAKDHGRGASMHGRSWSVILYDETRLRLDQSTMSSSLSGQVVI